MLPATDPGTVEELLAQSSWLRRLAATLVAGEDAAEDLVQETWLAALRSPPRSAGSPRPWLARIARNLASNFRRGEARRRAHESAVPPAAAALDPGTVVGEVEAQRMLAEAVLRLEEPLRTAVVLRYLRGLDSPAIGRLQGVPAGTVRWRLKRALELLRADLDRRCGGRRSWCSAVAVLLPEASAASATTALAKATLELGGTVALAATGFLVLLGASWLAVRDEPRPKASLAANATLEAPLARDAEEVELAEAGRLERLSETEQRLRGTMLLAPDASTSKSGPRRRGSIRGQLLIAGSQDVLDEALTVRLRSGDLRVKETVTTAADGSFTSKRSFPRGFVLADVLRPAGDSAGDYEAFFDPRSDEEWTLAVRWPNFVRGRLVDRQGQPLTEAEIRLFEGGLEKPPDRSRDGTFSFSNLSRGPCKVTVRRGFERHELSVHVVRGPNELGDVVVPFRERVGPISGRLRSTLGKPDGTLVLTDLASGTCFESEITMRDSQEVACFAFEEVPLGEYRLTFYPCDGLRYTTPTRFVRPPATDIEFVATGEIDPLRFRATDAQSGEEIGATAWVLRSGRWCGLDFPCEPADVERWVLVAEGHRPASGGTIEAARVDARLEPGWSCALFFAEGSGGAYPDRRGPVAGVEVLIDGLLLARSDQDGLALVNLPHEPGRIGDKIFLECRLDGWVLESGDLIVENSVVLSDPGEVYSFVVMRRE